jgi:hypothetical protein
MAEFQTTATSLYMVRGSGLVELAPYTAGEPSWQSVGAIAVDSLSVEMDAPIVREEHDNADSFDRFNKQELKLMFTQLELLRLDIWEIIYGTLIDIYMDSNETKIMGGHSSEIPYFMTRITTKNGDNPFILTAYKCNVQKMFGFQYKKDDGDDSRINNPVEIIAKSDDQRNGYVWELQSQFYG